MNAKNAPIAYYNITTPNAELGSLKGMERNNFNIVNDMYIEKWKNSAFKNDALKNVGLHFRILIFPFHANILHDI